MRYAGAATCRLAGQRRRCGAAGSRVTEISSRRGVHSEIPTTPRARCEAWVPGRWKAAAARWSQTSQ